MRSVIPFPVYYRGFHPQTEAPAINLVISHKRITGVWVYGYYAYTEADDKHWIFSADGAQRQEVLPETVGLLEPTSGRWSGDVCYFQGELRGILCFGRHKDVNNLKREEVSFYIDWQGNSLQAAILRQDLLFWSRSKSVTWSGTKWDPKPISKKKH